MHKTEQAHQKQQVGKVEAKHTSNCRRTDVWNVCDWIITFGARKRRENDGFIQVT